MKIYNIIITKQCYAKVSARSEEEAVEIGYDLIDSENYDDETITEVRSLGESAENDEMWIEDALDYEEEGGYQYLEDDEIDNDW